ncbi:helix-turn-helix domain-containing protein [Butyrivibrio sp. AE3004]|uniref:helix-turn-helix domain-containing protein n=1 Tax=Butyrivibrio sp. AE3004 TaxID=1506994 RepID=UPI0004948E90|nr:helix-turn-helix domain-containing protein [Butyrivibrio sp. AE3004]
MPNSKVTTITIPLKTEKWQEDLLEKRMEICRSIYNAMLSERIKTYEKMLNSVEYKKCIDTIYQAYRETDKEKKKELKNSLEYKQAVQQEKQLMMDNGFTDFHFRSIASIHAKHFADVIPSNVVIRSIGIPMWAAFQKKIYGNAKKVYFKKPGELHTLITNNLSGMVIANKKGKSVKNMSPDEEYWCSYRSKAGKNLMMPLILDRKDIYLMKMIEHDIKVVRLIRKNIKGRSRYAVQLVVDGAPYIKKDNDGKTLHPIGDKKLGVYIDTTSITVFDGENIEKINIRLHDDREKDIGELQQFMDRSKRISNAENFNEDGTIKKGVYENKHRISLKWNYSNNYMKAKARLADIRRIQGEKRKIRANMIANEILEMGHDININDYSFSRAAARQTFSEGEELTKRGTAKSKKKAGKAIMENAPAMIVSLMDMKLQQRGYDGLKKCKLHIDSKIEDYRDFYAKELFEMK